MTCPVCDYSGVKPRYRMRDRFFDSVPDEFVLHHCSSCGLMYLDEKEVASRIGEFYPPGYWWRSPDSGPGALSSLESRYRNWMIRHDQLKFLQSAVPQPEGVRLLDVGCGNGTFLQAALEAGYDAYGLEQSAEACRIARRRVPEGRVIEGDESALIERGEAFEVLTLFHALEHIPGPFRYLKTLHKLLGRPGKLIVQVPNSDSWQARLFGSRWYGLDCPRHIFNYNTYALLHLLGRAGFRIHRLRHFSLRDNAACLASSLFPSLDPMSQKVRLLRRTGKRHSLGLALREAAYLPAFALAQPLAWLEARMGRGASITVYATLEDFPF
ncbi:MAG: class I SAM-dependent methyltransferase [Acidobacteriota bacterium]